LHRDLLTAPVWDPDQRENWETGSLLAKPLAASVRGNLRSGHRLRLASQRHHSLVLYGSLVTLVFGLNSTIVKPTFDTGALQF